MLDAGFLVAVERGDRRARDAIEAFVRIGEPLHTTHAVVAQVWRNGTTQVRLSRFLRHVTVHRFDDGRRVGELLARTGSDDVVDAHLVQVAAALGDDILTGDVADLGALSAAMGQRGPAIREWPPST